MGDIDRRETSDILEEIRKDCWPKVAGIFAILTFIVSCIALYLQVKK